MVTPTNLPDFLAGYVTPQSERILRRRTAIKDHLEKRQLLVQWQGDITENATCEDVDFIAISYPSVHLEDEVTSEGEAMIQVAR